MNDTHCTASENIIGAPKIRNNYGPIQYDIVISEK